MNNEAEIKISRARISLQRNHPFFSYLSLFLKPIEAKIPTIRVDIKGNLYYNPSFVNGLNDNEMVGVLIHEIGHLCFLHHTRGLNFNQQIGNIAMDISVNQMLKDNGFILPSGAIWSNNENEVMVFNKIIKKVADKPFEEIYYEIYEEVKDKIREELEGYEIDGSSNDGKGKVKSFDKHIKGKGNGEGLSKEERENLEKVWVDRIMEAGTISKIAGKEPNGLDRIIGKLHESKVNWKALLQKYIQSYLPSDYSYQRCSKKSISSGFYMPSEIKERIEVYCCIDLSGSISDNDLSLFLSEICGIAKAYREKIKFHLWTHQTEVDNKYIVENGSVQKILNLKMIGNGGTSHKDCFSQLAKERECKVCIFFTDGYSDLNEINFNNKFDSIFAISKNGSEEQLKGKRVKVIKLDR